MLACDVQLCIRCGEWSPLSNYYVKPKSISKDYPNERYPHCKICDKKGGQKYRDTRSRAMRARARKRSGEWQITNRDKHRQQCLDYYYRNQQVCKEKVSKRQHERYWEDPEYRIRAVMRARAKGVLRGIKKDVTSELVGCSTKTHVEYLESRFLDGMTWGNYGSEWHVDHIVPISSFNLLDGKECKKAFHYTNTQPLWAGDNLRKGAKMPADMV